MADYRVVLSRSTRKELEGLPEKIADRIVRQLEALSRLPRPSGCLKLRGASQWRIRVGDYRVIYEIDDSARLIEIGYIRHRKDVYRDI
jgi:mRNA interferase RelE/StbE